MSFCEKSMVVQWVRTNPLTNSVIYHHSLLAGLRTHSAAHAAWQAVETLCAVQLGRWFAAGEEHEELQAAWSAWVAASQHRFFLTWMATQHDMRCCHSLKEPGHMLEMNSDHEVILVWLILPRINKSESPVTKKSTLPSMERLSKKLSFLSLQMSIFVATFINSPNASIWFKSALTSAFLKNFLNFGLFETSKNYSINSVEKISVIFPDSRRKSNSGCLFEIK